MLYRAYEAHSDALGPVRIMAEAARGLFIQPWPLVSEMPLVKSAAAALDLLSNAGIAHGRPSFGITSTTVAGKEVSVREIPVIESPFCTLLHFRKSSPALQPTVLLVAPLSGHFSTLLRGTVEALLPDHDVFITDWHNARNIPLLHGRFDLDDEIDLLIRFIRYLGPETHLIAVCQPSVPVLVAVSLLAGSNDPVQPRSTVLMGGPIDTRVNPTQVNAVATAHPMEWFESHVIETVPLRYKGAFRRVYPGFLQLAGFLSMNLDRHVGAHVDMFHNLVKGDGESARATRAFYDEYRSVMDLPADFYLQTIDRVFQQHALPLGTFKSRGVPVEPQAVTRTALMTIEGENDDICSVGQTFAAQDLCAALPSSMRKHHMQKGVGHYGVFNGRRWRNEIYPLVRDFIRAND